MALPVPELELEDKDGTIYPLAWPGREAMGVSGLGMPHVKHWSTRSPFQIGATHWGYAVRPRIINLVLYARGSDRVCMWTRRAANCAMLNPLLSPHKLRLSYGWNAYEVHELWFNSGYSLDSSQQTVNTQIGGVQFVAYDPMWKWVTAPLGVGQTRGPDGSICITTSTFVTSQELQLAFFSPFLLGTTTGTATLNCDNVGSWEVSPTITIEGPTEDWQLTNVATGKAITWDGYSIAAGEIITIDTKNGTAVDASDNDLTSYVGGDIANFKLQPGANALTLFVTGAVVSGTTEISACWYVESIGV